MNVAPGSCVQSTSTQGLRPLAGMDLFLAALSEAAGQKARGMQHLVALHRCFPKPRSQEFSVSAPRHYHTSDFMKFKNQIPPKLAKLESPWSSPFPLAIPWKMLIHVLPMGPSDCLHTPQGLTTAEGLHRAVCTWGLTSASC